MKKILLLGSTGLIGATVYQKLADAYEIIRLGRSAECELNADLSRPETIDALGISDIDFVIHCAGVTDEDFRDRTADAFIQSSIGMNALIKKAVAAKASRFIYISTSHVYGRQAGVIDEDSPSNPLSDYALAHYLSEQTLKRNAARFDNIFVLRPNAVFGEPLFMDKFDRWNLIPYSFPLEAVYDRRIVLRSSGEQKRNFVSTNDIANLISHLLTAERVNSFEIINAVGKDTMSVYEFGLKCAGIYERLSGNTCAVERPAVFETSDEVGFSYTTKFEFPLEKDELDAGVTGLMGKILQEDKNGKRYSA